MTETEVISVTEEDILAGGESIQAEKRSAKKVCRNCPSKNSLLCVGYGPGTPFAAVGDRTDPSAIFDADGNPLTINSHPTGYPGYVSPAIAEKGIKSIFIRTALPGSAVLPGRQKCSLRAPLTKKCGRCSGMQ